MVSFLDESGILREYRALCRRWEQVGGKVCLIRLSSIGDMVLCTPVIRWLHLRFPLLELHFVTKPAMDQVIAYHPYLHRVHLWQPSDRAVLQNLRREGFDAVIDLHHNLRTMRWRFLGAVTGPGIPWWTYPKGNLLKWWMVRTKFKPKHPLHTVQKYARMLAPLGLRDDGLGLDWSFSPEWARSFSSLPATEWGPPLRTVFGWGPQASVVALALGAQHATKCLPEDLLLALCQKLPGPVLLLGGPQDKDLANRLIEASGRKDLGHACGTWDLQTSAAALKQAACLITPDTGLMHMAAALSVKTFVLWGSTVPEFGMYPWTKGTTTYESFEVTLPCRPCSKLGHPSCPLGHFRCMRLQDLDQVVQRVQVFLRHYPLKELPPVGKTP